jgi:hypothetical protein
MFSEAFSIKFMRKTSQELAIELDFPQRNYINISKFGRRFLANGNLKQTTEQE